MTQIQQPASTPAPSSTPLDTPPSLAPPPALTPPRLRCTPLYYPCEGEYDVVRHSEDANSKFYVVMRGRSEHIFGNWISADNQTNGYSNAEKTSAKTWDDAWAKWGLHCDRNHLNGCPAPRPPIGFSPPFPRQQPPPPASWNPIPGSTPLTVSVPPVAAPTVPSAPAPSPSSHPPDVTATQVQVPSGLLSPSSSQPRPRVTPQTRVQLTSLYPEQAAAAARSSQSASQPASSSLSVPGPCSPGPSSSPAGPSQPSGTMFYGVSGVLKVFTERSAAVLAMTTPPTTPPRSLICTTDLVKLEQFIGSYSPPGAPFMFYGVQGVEQIFAALENAVASIPVAPLVYPTILCSTELDEVEAYVHEEPAE
ncbi:hypothetical protein B0H11DRAFT_2229824 [Mycena galericulata]|nr:hypothetical protein B0H11DRAFT_2229824 [Mycena galericulata]